MDDTDDGLIYEPAPEVTKAFWREFNCIVPDAPSGGGAKMLKFVWGMDEKEYVAGQWICRYGDIENDPPKYIGRPGWVLVGWQSPDVYHREYWESQKHLLGEWPHNGVYDFIEYHMDTNKQYLPLDNSALERVRNWKYWQSKGTNRSVEELMRKRLLRWTLQQQRKQEAAKVVSTRFGKSFVKMTEDQTNRAYSIPTGGFKKTEGGILVKG